MSGRTFLNLPRTLPRRYASTLASGGTMHAFAPASMPMLHMDILSATDSDVTALPMTSIER